MMADIREARDAEVARPMWRTPTLSEDMIAEVTLFTVGGAGADAGAASPGYSTLGLS
jgi:hypothetical protein